MEFFACFGCVLGFLLIADDLTEKQRKLSEFLK